MTANIERVRQRPPKFIRIIKARPRLFIAVAIGAMIALALATLTNWRVASSLLVGWDVCAGLYLVLAFHTMSQADVHHMRRRARLQDEGAASFVKSWNDLMDRVAAKSSTMLKAS